MTQFEFEKKLAALESDLVSEKMESEIAIRDLKIEKEELEAEHLRKIADVKKKILYQENIICIRKKQYAAQKARLFNEFEKNEN